MIARNSITIFFMLTAAIFGIISCKDPSSFKYTSADCGEFRMNIPDHMDKTTDLVRSAEVQYEDHNLDYYIIAFRQEAISQMNDSVMLCTLCAGGLHQLQFQKENISLPVYQVNAKGLPSAFLGLDTENEEGDKLFYSISCVKGTNSILTIYQWCLLRDKEKFLPVMKKVMSESEELLKK